MGRQGQTGGEGKREGEGKEKEKGNERSGLERLGLSLEWEINPGPIFSLPPLRKKWGSRRKMAGPSGKFNLPSQI